MPSRGFSFCLITILLVLSPVHSQERGLRPTEPATVTTLPVAGKRFALLVGVDRYADTQISTLGGAANDAGLLRDALVAHAGFQAEQVIVLASDQPPERQPTRGNILRRLSNLTTVVPADGLLLFAFAGHGIERQGQAFLLPADAQVSDDVNLLGQTALSAESIADWLRKIGVKQVILILDACRNDPAGRANVDNPLTPAFTGPFDFARRNQDIQAFVTLYATEVGHRAYEYTEKRHGYFTWALVEGLQGGAANAQGEVTLAQLLSYLEERVPKQVLLDLGAGKQQKPWARTEGFGVNELVLAVPQDGTRAATPSAATPATAAPPPQRSAAVAREPQPLTASLHLPGMTWEGETPYGAFTIEFLEAGKLRYTLLSKNARPVHGTWKKHENMLFISIGGRVTWQGQIDNGIARGEAAGIEGEKHSWFMTPKAP